MRISVQVDFRDAVAQLVGAETRQVPFAISKTLNALAFEARQHVVNVTGPRDFDLRNRRFLGVALRVDPARKDRLEARIFDRLGREYLRTQAEGGEKMPRGTMLAIPAKAIKGSRGASGIPKRLRPRNLAGAFKLKTRDGEYLARRTGRANRLEVVYLLERKAKIPQRFRAYEDAETLVRQRANAVFAEQLAKALATARR